MAPGLVIGIAGALIMGRYLQSLLFGVTDQGAVTYLTVTASLALASTLAAYLPARRASLIDPIDALSCE